MGLGRQIRRLQGDDSSNRPSWLFIYYLVNTSIKEGDRIFLIRLGEEPRGIVASGHAASTVFYGPHWDMSRAMKGDLCKRIFIKFDKILEPYGQGIIPIGELKERFHRYCWSAQVSGISIPDEIAIELERIWK